MNEKFDAEEFKMEVTTEEISKEEAIKMLKTINDKLEDIIKELNKRD